MDLKYLRNLIKILEGSNVSEINIEEDDLKVNIKTGHVYSEPPVTAPMVVKQVETNVPASAVSASNAEQVSAPEKADGDYITSPMVGTFYRASSPDADPFVEVEKTADKDSTLCIIEAMKIMNEIKCEKKCKIKKILVENGDPVEFDQKLFEVEYL